MDGECLLGSCTIAYNGNRLTEGEYLRSQSACCSAFWAAGLELGHRRGFVLFGIVVQEESRITIKRDKPAPALPKPMGVVCITIVEEVVCIG